MMAFLKYYSVIVKNSQNINLRIEWKFKSKHLFQIPYLENKDKLEIVLKIYIIAPSSIMVILHIVYFYIKLIFILLPSKLNKFYLK